MVLTSVPSMDPFENMMKTEDFFFLKKITPTFLKAMEVSQLEVHLWILVFVCVLGWWTPGVLVC